MIEVYGTTFARIAEIKRGMLVRRCRFSPRSGRTRDRG
jgi:hypothetical protein